MESVDFNKFFNIFVTDFTFYGIVSLQTYAIASIPCQILAALGYESVAALYTTGVLMTAIVYSYQEGPNDNWHIRFWTQAILLWCCYANFILLLRYFFEAVDTLSWSFVFPRHNTMLKLKEPESLRAVLAFPIFELFSVFYVIFGYTVFIRITFIGFHFAISRRYYVYYY